MKTIYDTSLEHQGDGLFTIGALLDAGKEIEATHLLICLENDPGRNIGSDYFEEHEALFVTAGEDLDSCIEQCQGGCPFVKAYPI